VSGLRYEVSIAFNHGRDEGSRRVKSEHRSERAAAKAAHDLRNDSGWAPRVLDRETDTDITLDAWDRAGLS
jgi:hypothetical protein